MKSRLISPSDPAWVALVATVEHDFYHLPAYVEVSARQDGGTPAALHVEDAGRELLVPIVIRPIEGSGDVDATSPYGYPGSLSSASPDGGFETEALMAGIDELRAQGLVSLFIRLHPLLNPSPPEGAGSLVQHGNTVTVDLSLTPEELWSQTRRNHRQQIRQARSAGYVPTVDAGLARIEDFKRLYRTTMEQRAASDYYFFDDDYFDDLQRALGASLGLAYVELDDAIVAAALFVRTGGIVQMHLTGHDPEHSRSQPMKLLFDHVRTWAREQGERWLHLGGGRGGNDDSLFHFKAGFSPLQQPFFTRRIVIQPERYDVLVSKRSTDLDPDDPSAHFPLYRG
jgi:hypothetical protein